MDYIKLVEEQNEALQAKLAKAEEALKLYDEVAGFDIFKAQMKDDVEHSRTFRDNVCRVIQRQAPVGSLTEREAKEIANALMFSVFDNRNYD